MSSPATGNKVTLTAKGFSLTFNRHWTASPKNEFDLEVLATDNTRHTLQVRNLNDPDDNDLVCLLLRRIANAGADAGWTFTSQNGVIVG